MSWFMRFIPCVWTLLAAIHHARAVDFEQDGVDRITPSDSEGYDQNDRLLYDCDLDDFYYNTRMTMLVPGINDPGCSEAEMSEIDGILTGAYNSIIDVDPRLHDVVNWTMEICSTSTERRQLRGRRLLNRWELDWRNVAGSGRCKWCGSRNKDADHRRLQDRFGAGTKMTSSPRRKSLPQAKKVQSTDLGIQHGDGDDHRKLQSVGNITGFKLWNTEDEFNPVLIKTVEHADVYDIKDFGNKFTIEAETTGTIGSVQFSLDSTENFKVENFPPYFLDGNSNKHLKYFTCEELSTVGTHTITVTPYSSKYQEGTQGTSVTFSILVVDGSTNAAKEAAPGSRQELIYLLEDDLSFYISGMINLDYFGRTDHCLGENLVYVDVNLSPVSEAHLECGSTNVFSNS